MKLIQVENMLQRKAKNIEKLFSGTAFDMMNIQLQKGETIPEHSAPNEVVIICRKGVVKFPVEGKETMLNENSVLFLEPNENHSLEAVEDCEVLVIRMKG